MTVQINYKSTKLKKNSSNIVLFVNEKFDVSGLKKHISNNEYHFVSDLINCNIYETEYCLNIIKDKIK